MAHFAKIGMNGKVIGVLTCGNNDMKDADGVEDESVGQQYLETHNNWPAQMWIQTSYNTGNNKHYSTNELLMGMFDLVDIVMDEMDEGYVHLTIDQQPYLQGYLPILQMYLMKEFGLSAWDVNTGKAFVYPSDVADVRKYIEMGVR